VELHVAFLPQECGDMRGRVAVVVDVLRATTSILTLFERGAAEVMAAPTVDAARRYAAAEAGRVRAAPGPVDGRRAGERPPDQARGPVRTAGEEGGLAPVGFEFGNSPAAFARAQVAGSRVVIATTNGTRALHAVRGAPVVLAACLRNRRAAARAAAEAALEGGFDVTVVCAGREERFSLDDAYTAGAIADAAVEYLASRTPCRTTDAVLGASMLYRSWPDAAALFRLTAAGRNVVAIGLEEDLTYCAVPDSSDIVPRVGAGLALLDA
jgi:2-phosphosulfolactate phosphatase